MKSNESFPTVKPRDLQLQKNYRVEPSHYPDSRWEITFFGHTMMRYGHRANLDFEGLVRHIALPQRKAMHWDGDLESRSLEKKSQKCFAPVTFRNNRRLKENADKCSIFVWDIDNGKVSYDSVKEFLEINNTQYIMHTSYSHTPQKHKFRVILPMYQPFRAQYWDAYQEISEKLFNRAFRDWPDLGALQNRASTYNCAYLTPHYRSDWNEGGKGIGQVDLKEKIQRRYDEMQRDKAHKIIENQFKSSSTRRRRICDIDDRSDRIARLLTENGAREKFALFLNSKKSGDYWTKWKCPACGRKDATAFHIEKGLAYCNHKKSCGETWLLPELAKLKGWNG